jgi:D-aminoacyl-tRNA deacylase
MRLVVQRSDGAELWINGKCHSKCAPGLLILFGTRTGDTEPSCAWLADKVVNLRIFEDDDGKMNRSILETGGEIMVVSQFTLYADTRKGRRPSFIEAQEPKEAERLYERFVSLVSAAGVIVASGVFGARMDIRFTNSGPVTIIMDHDVS